MSIEVKLVGTMKAMSQIGQRCSFLGYFQAFQDFRVFFKVFPDLPSSSTITSNLTQIDFIMKIIIKVGFHHIVQMRCGLNVVSSTSLDAIILKSENGVVKYYVKSFGKI